MARPNRLALALLLSAAAVALAACGEEDAQLLPGETAREITANLDAVEQLADEGDCAGADSAARQVGEQVEALRGVDARLKRALEQGAARLSEVVAECEESSTEAIAPARVPGEAEEEADGTEEKKDERDGKGKGGGKGNGESDDEGEGNGEGKGDGGEEGGGRGNEGGGPEESPPAPPAEEAEEGPSGGLSPGSPVGGGE